ncbi:oligosaccharide flippase family protein [Microbacterium amylolyticum]|uniref:O-antigen/teichoic acid export membrane protein n=1 Tax=Microbacterium amylolyticum TaxID=936337 RepID=A0ABS4ZJE0_9MICO|nr:oligosaccharide flippase family protein [Microbacterium amylolyticum]MBP2437070.1 O-antigen/teichoic acid export membrane protein [Microbacterium amylolyticum]
MSWFRRALGSIAEDSPSLLAFARIFSAGLALVSAPIVARAIGPAGRGETAAVIAIFHIVPVVLAFGVPLAVRRRAAMPAGARIVASARIIALLGFVGAIPISVTLHLTMFSTFQPLAALVATMSVLLAPVVVSWTCDVSVLVAQSRYRAIALIQLTPPVSYLVVVLALWLSDSASTGTVLIAYVCGHVLACIVGLCLVRASWQGAWREIPSLAREGLRFSGSSLAETATNRMDQAIALPLIGATQAGYYAVATTIVTIPLAFGQALGAAYFTPIVRAEAGEPRRKLQQQATRSAIALALVCFPLLCLATPVVVPLLFGPSFANAVPVVWVASIGGFAMTSGYVISMALAAEGRGGRMSISQTVALVVSVGSLIVLGPILGAVGAALASTMGYFVMMLMLSGGLKAPFRAFVPMPNDLQEAIKRLVKRG